MTLRSTADGKQMPLEGTSDLATSVFFHTGYICILSHVKVT